MEKLKEEVIFDPYLPEKWPDPIPAYTELLNEHPVYYLKKRDVYILTRYEDIITALKDWKTYSSGAGGNLLEEIPERIGNSVGTTDPPLHTKFRKTIGNVFTPRFVESLEDQMREVVRDLINNFKNTRKFEANLELGTPYTARVIAKMIGIPDEDIPFFIETVNSGATLTEEEKNDPDKTRIMVRKMASYCEKLVEKKVANPGNDIISKLLAAEFEGKKMGPKEIALTSVTLIGAAFQSTSLAITCSLATIHKNQEVLEEVRRNPDLIPKMIEEALRYDGSTIGFKRTAMRDIELHGTTIPKGSRVFLLFGAANHDQRFFPNPSKFDIHRENNKHLGFGWGLHHCLGAPIARQMMRIMYEELLPIIGDFEIDYERVVYSGQPQFRGYLSLPVHF